MTATHPERNLPPGVWVVVAVGEARSGRMARFEQLLSGDLRPRLRYFQALKPTGAA
jgi:hypothetical protein